MVALIESLHEKESSSNAPRNLRQFSETVILPTLTDSYRDKYRTALNHLAKFVGRDPSVEDLSSTNILGTLTSMLKLDRSPETVAIVRRTLLAIALRAFQAELLIELPSVAWGRHRAKKDTHLLRGE